MEYYNEVKNNNIKTYSAAPDLAISYKTLHFKKYTFLCIFKIEKPFSLITSMGVAF